MLWEAEEELLREGELVCGADTEDRLPGFVTGEAMLSKSNLAQLSTAKYQFIIGAQIQTESETIKQQILAPVYQARYLLMPPPLPAWPSGPPPARA